MLPTRRLRLSRGAVRRHPLQLDLEAIVGRQARACGNQPPHDHVFLESNQAIDLAVDGRFGQHPGGLLERGRRDEALGRQRGLGDAEQERLADGRFAAVHQDAGVFLIEAPLLGLIAHQEIGIADLLDPHPPQHLAHDDLDMLVIDAHALQPVDLLDLIDQILGQRLFAEDRQDIVRVRRTFHQRFTRADKVALVHADMLALGNQVFARLADLRRDHHLALALGILAERDLAVDFGNDRELLGLARLEEFGDARQTAGDVLGLGGFARQLGNHVTGLDVRPFGDIDIGADRQEVARILFAPVGRGHPRRAAAFVLDRDTRPRLEILRFDNHVVAGARAVVELLLHRAAFEDIAVLHRARDLGQDGRGVGIPFGDQLTGLDRVTVALAPARAVHQRIAFALALAARSALVGHADRDFAMPRHHDQAFAARRVIVANLDGLDVMQPQHAVVARFERGLLGAPTRRAADMERAHRELRAGLADRLRGHDADGLAHVDQMAAAEVAPVTAHAHALTRLAGEDRADTDALEAGVFDGRDLVLIDHFV